MKEILNKLISIFFLLFILSGCSYNPASHIDNKHDSLDGKLHNSTPYLHLWDEHDERIREFN